MKCASQNLVSVTREDPSGPAATRLIAALSAELGGRYGDDGTGGFRPDDVQGPGGAFVVAWLGERAVGCGALRPLAPGVGELKRMFVAGDARRQGIARRILEALETTARERGYEALRLETGTLQPEAIDLYESAGYQRIAPYCLYADDPLSVCFEKRLPGNDEGGTREGNG